MWCDAPALAAAARALGVPAYRRDGWGTSGNALLPDRRVVAEARDIVRRHGVRLVHTFSTVPLKGLLPVARDERLPLLAHLHLIPTLDERHYSLLHQASLVVGVGRAAVRGLLDDGFPPRRARVIHNGVDPARLDGGDARALRGELGIGPRDVVFCTLGSLIRRKGTDVVLGAMRGLAGRRDDCRLLVVGDGSERDALESDARALGVERVVHFLGRREDVGAVLRDAADVLVTAAREEAFPLNVLEGAYCGLPIVASDIDPHLEFVADGEVGLLFPTGDAAALARAMERLAGDATFRRRLGEEGRARVRSSFLVAHYVGAFQDAYDALLAAPRSAYGWLGGSRWPRTYTRWVVDALGRRLPGRGR